MPCFYVSGRQGLHASLGVTKAFIMWISHCHALSAAIHFQKRWRTNSVECHGKMGHLVSIAWWIWPLQVLTATVQCQMSQRSLVSLGVQWSVHIVFYWSLKCRDKIPCNFFSTTLGMICLLRRISWPNFVENWRKAIGLLWLGHWNLWGFHWSVSICP